ncbi:MAG: symmetrical bis(5'-nucleosyl)-tetraphosphatase [Campylobacterales bacterium]|nr:symmetrical bis(5'-nucleosyl)-tetraphosphatase [Campylobacterales bacterium]
MIWAIGDIQGCYSAFMKLLEKIEFDLARDKLWLVGDIVNRGEGSLEMLEFAYRHKENIEIVLGNHDIALIAAFYGLKKSNPTIDPILRSSRSKELIEWLRKQKFLHIDAELGYCMVHAGISPRFNLEEAKFWSERLSEKLSGNDAKRWLEKIMKSPEGRIRYGKTEEEDEMYALSSFTRMRYCFGDKSLELLQKGSPGAKKDLTMPWFFHPDRKKIEQKIIFGHWSTLGFHRNESVLGLDTGCIWGGALSAARIDDKSEKIITFECE